MLAKFSVKKPFTVLVGVVLVIVLGIVAFTNMTPDLLPSLDLPYVIVVTSVIGASPEEVEATVTSPVEQAMATLENIKSISSTSRENSSMVFIEFSDSVNMDVVGVDIREKLNLLEEYWDENAGTPYIMKINPNVIPVSVLAVDIEGMDTIALSEYVENRVIPRFEGVEGVASVSISGNIRQSIDVRLSQDKIDTVNAKMSGAITERFAEAKEAAEGGISQAENALANADMMKIGAAAKQSALLEKLVSSQLQLAAGKAEKQAYQTALREEITALQAAVAAVEQNREETEAAYTAVQAQIALLEQAVTALDPTLENYAAQLADLETQLAAQRTALEAINAGGAYDAAIAQLQSQIDLLNGVAAAMNAQDAAYQTTLPLLQTQIASLNRILSGIRPEDSPDAIIAALQAEIARCEAGILQYAAEAAAIDASLASIAGQEQAILAEAVSDVQKVGAMEVQLNRTVNTLSNTLTQIESAETSMLQSADLTGILTMETVSGLLMAQNFSMPAGYVSGDGEDYLVRVGDKIEDFEELRDLMLFDFGEEGVEPVYLRDVADVTLTDNAASTYAKIDGKDGVLLSFQKQSNYATADVASGINDMAAALSLETDGLKVTALMDQGDYIHVVVDSVLGNLLLGAALAVIILLIFLRDIRPTFIVACSIPISVTFAIVLMYFSGVTLNVISLAGLAVGVGMLVDNSIVVIENIYRLRSIGITGIKAAVSGAGQVAAAITSSTLTTVCVFFPIVFVEGLTRQLFTDMVLTIAYSLFASLIIALTLVPAIAPGLLRRVKQIDPGNPGGFMRFYEKMIRFALGRRMLFLLLSVAVLAASALLAYSRGFAFMPEMESTEIMVSLRMPEEYTFDDTRAAADELSARFAKIENVGTVGAMMAESLASIVGLGGMPGGGGEEETGAVTMYVLTGDTRSNVQKGVSEQLAEILAEYPEIGYSITGAANMTSMMSALGGEGITVNLYGEELGEMQRIAAEVGEIMERVDGVTDVNNGIEDTLPELKITVDKEKATQNGLTVAEVYQKVSAALTESRSAASISMEGKTISITIRSEEAESMTPQDIRSYRFTVSGRLGEEKEVRLADIAEISEARAFNAISRSEQRRYLSITAGIEDGYNVSFVTGDVRSALQSYDTGAGAGCSLEFEGENETIMDALSDLGLMLLLGVVIVYLIMVAQFQSLLSPFIVMFTIPLAFTGGFLALFLSGMELSIVSMIGFVMLVGVIVNNGIVLIDYMNQLRAEGKDLTEAIVEASVTRLRPIIMTALTTVLGLLPLAVGAGTGAELMQPVAVVCIGGLVYATLMTLFIIPIIYSAFMKKPPRIVGDELTEIVGD